ncbi:uncharacterized protein [Nothobranchius furzeri]
MKIHPVFHVSLLKPVISSSLCPPTDPPPPVRLADGGLGYRVRCLLDMRRCGRGFQYLVEWEGYGPEHRQWILRSWIDDPSLIRDFEMARSSSSSSSSALPPGGVPWGGGGGGGGWYCHGLRCIPAVTPCFLSFPSAGGRVWRLTKLQQICSSAGQVYLSS